MDRAKLIADNQELTTQLQLEKNNVHLLGRMVFEMARNQHLFGSCTSCQAKAFCDDEKACPDTLFMDCFATYAEYIKRECQKKEKGGTWVIS